MEELVKVYKDYIKLLDEEKKIKRKIEKYK
jgi:hypothetical protein